MSALTQDSRFAEALEGEGGKPQNMSSLLDRVEERGRKDGLQEGLQKGRQEGSDQKQLQNIRSLMITMKWTAKQAMDALMISEADQSKYIARL